MTMERHESAPAQFAGPNVAPSDEAPVSNLAALLDAFTNAITHPDAETVGGFAGTLQALHGELAMLAGHFGADMGAQDGDPIDFDEIFPDLARDIPHPAPEPGLAADEELEHLCRELSR